ncbi:DUF554 domain-containing protein [Propionispora hippei]|uniref:Membrane protein YdfK n=1 Tax=Propionispora hippei DSM 15287 TaxID=1123003 RepID=A0A1M6PGT2_9FIRM|nr:DUF554 domain-containing protein [Propionispora hippei]SHK07166.1 hypothetical protein SAMN02745170_04040 [Propionispora hippei DSM 15287]
MPIGVLVDCFCILLGGTLGSKFKSVIPDHIKKPLNIIFGISAISIGIVSMIKLKSLPAVILSLILGCLIGELIKLDTHIKNIFSKLICKSNFNIEGDYEEYMNFYIIVAVTFCASGANIFGALNEGMTGDMTILLSKAVMDVFASVIFATTLGYAINLIVIPQCLILSTLFYLARLIMPAVSPAMLSDFIAIGGVLTFILGLSILKIIKIHVANLLPALMLIFLTSYIFGLLL